MPAKDYEYVLIIDHSNQVKKEREQEGKEERTFILCPFRLLELKKLVML
jgi:hypothetical protein